MKQVIWLIKLLFVESESHICRIKKHWPRYQNTIKYDIIVCMKFCATLRKLWWMLCSPQRAALNMKVAVSSSVREPRVEYLPWWRQQMETFSALLSLCAGNSPVTTEFPAQKPVMQSFVVLFDLRLNKLLSELSRGPWLETPSRPWWRHCIGNCLFIPKIATCSVFTAIRYCFASFCPG